MAKKTASPKKQKNIEETLWDSANKLRGTVEPSTEIEEVRNNLMRLIDKAENAA